MARLNKIIEYLKYIIEYKNKKIKNVNSFYIICGK